jgi:hypothetical protein
MQDMYEKIMSFMPSLHKKKAYTGKKIGGMKSVMKFAGGNKMTSKMAGC